MREELLEYLSHKGTLVEPEAAELLLRMSDPVRTVRSLIDGEIEEQFRIAQMLFERRNVGVEAREDEAAIAFDPDCPQAVVLARERREALVRHFHR